MMKSTPFLRHALCLSVLSALAVSVPVFGNESSAQDALPSLTIDLKNVTVSGLSSGGYMATQFQLAHSDWVKGVGVIAGGPYFCAQGDITTALAQCVNKVEGEINLEALNEKAKQYETEGKIASLSNMKDTKVWLFHGTQDTRVIAPVS
ncbi:MAG: prolyl oligopeptidase family serine peptidase, partial [Alteromonas macleodii]|nr:prolyl oligopeptidase family serine peptidase [Alteromonas macleodii]